MNIEVVKAFLTLFGCFLLLLAAFSFSLTSIPRKLSRLLMMIVFACALGNVVTYADNGQRPLNWSLLMIVILIIIAVWLSVAPKLLKPRRVSKSLIVSVHQ